MRTPEQRLCASVYHRQQVLWLLILLIAALYAPGAQSSEGNGRQVESSSVSHTQADDAGDRIPLILVLRSTSESLGPTPLGEVFRDFGLDEPWELLVSQPQEHVDEDGRIQLQGVGLSCWWGKVPQERLSRLAPLGTMHSVADGLAGFHIHDELASPALDGSREIIGTGPVWSEGVKGADQTVAILDSGVEYEHPFFSPERFGPGLCFSSTCPATGSTSLCPSGNVEPDGGHSNWACRKVPTTCWHGTHAASIVAGVDDTGGELTGIAPEAKLVSIQVYSKVKNIGYCGSTEPCLRSFKSDRLRALKYAYENPSKFDVVYMGQSHGAYEDQDECKRKNPCLEAAIEKLSNLGIPVIVPAGNGSRRDALGAPACLPGAIGVGATTEHDYVAGFSNVASFLDLMAPGVGIDAAVTGNMTSARQGTSAAAAHVAGAWAVLKQAAAEDTALEDILSALATTGEEVNGSPNGLRRINLCKAYESLTGKGPKCP